MIPRARHYPLVLETMGGLGDCIYARPFIRAWCMEEGGPVWITTPWPQLFADIPNARFHAPAGMKLRTQAKNMAATPRAVWDARFPARADRRTFTYRLRDPGMTILREIETDIGAPANQPFIFDLPDFGPSPVAGPVAVVRPVTLRREWANAARNPDPQYVARAADLLRAQGFTVVVVGDVDPATEPLHEPAPVGDINYLRGELGVEALLALVQHAAVVVGGIGWIVPAAIAAKVPAIFIGGGQGGHNGPAILVDPRMDASRARFILPDRYCRCRDMRHACDKRIRDFDARFVDALEQVAPTVPVAA